MLQQHGIVANCARILSTFKTYAKAWQENCSLPGLLVVRGDEDLLRGFSQRRAKLELGCVALCGLKLVTCTAITPLGQEVWLHTHKIQTLRYSCHGE